MYVSTNVYSEPTRTSRLNENVEMCTRGRFIRLVFIQQPDAIGDKKILS